ncbi:MAG: single-stranded DNA-binding protein, partial [Cyanobacteriota bacterium]
MSVNTIHLVGRAGRDPEVKFFESGNVVCNFTLAVNRRTSNKDEPPDWFDLEIWGKPAESAATHIKKGALLSIQGSLRFNHWTDSATGTQRSRPVIRVYQWNFEGSKRDNAETTMNNYPEEF